MRLSVLLALATFAVALTPIACASPTDDDPVSSPSEEGDAEDELKSLSVTDDDNGKTVTITKGQSLLLKLQSNPTTGYKWAVASTDRTFGYPASETFLKNGDGAVGSGGIQRFTWKTKSPLDMVGSHKVKLEYKRSWETNVAPAKTFNFTVKVVDGSCPQLSPPAPGFCPGGRITPKHNDAGCVTGYDCIAQCTPTSCGAGKWCSACWGHMACIPKGAMC
jgi:inhibitor of cysteine peptidase